MLIQVKDTNASTVDRLFDLYSESMAKLRDRFQSSDEMKQAYANFLTEFLSSPSQLILVEKVGNEWLSGLRAIEVAKGCWFIEAVETKTGKRNCGHGRRLLLETIAYLKNIGMQQITCQISKNNILSQQLHTSCGFLPTQEASVDPWGITDERTILYKYDLSR